MFIGEDLDRVDVLEKVLGKARFAHDLKMEGMLFGCVVRSEKPHARIVAIDLSAAMAVPGAARILSHKDIPGQNAYGVIRKDQPLLAADRVRYVGEPVLIVLGEGEEAAREVASRVKIEYEEIAPVLDIEEARRGVRVVHDSGNLFSYKKVRKGDV
ncbi:MAG: hypothetical protein ABSE25_14815, partial [Syntrophorhabdales bacterium]